MSYTNVDLVRPYLAASAPTGDRVLDQPLVFTGTGEHCFFAGAVDEDSVTVKSVRGHELIRAGVTLVDPTTILSASPLVPGSVVVASDSSLGTLYDENLDYIIDYEAGVLKLTDGGCISEGQGVTVWYQPYVLCGRGEDYSLDADVGVLKRLAGGDIAEGETIYVDYNPISPGYTEDLLLAAVAQANGMIEREIDPEGLFGADASLQAAATSRAVEIICRASAARELSSGRGQDRVALALMQLASRFADQSERLVSSFRPPYSGPAAPTRS